MLILDPMDHIRVPPHRVAGLDNWDGHIGAQQLGVVGFADGERTCGCRTTQGIILHIILQRAQDDPCHRLGNGHQIQRAIAGSLAAQCCPALIGAEHRTDCWRGDFLCGGAISCVKRIIRSDVTG